MFANQVYLLRENLREQGVVFAYSGYMTEDILSCVGDALKNKLASEDADKTTVRSVFAVFVEQMQNIIRYSVDRLPRSDGKGGPDISYGILTIGSETENYIVQAGNLILNKDVESMQNRLSTLRNMKRDELRAAYNERLRAPPEESSKGAGLGLIEIARRASQPIEFDFMNVDDRHAFFALKATI